MAEKPSAEAAGRPSPAILAGARPPGGAWDRFVHIMRDALPVAAIAVLATIIGYPLLNPRALTFVLAKDRVSSSPERLLMEEPRYRGVDANGRPFELRATSALQQSSKTPLLALMNPSASLETAGGPMTVSGSMGSYDLNAQTVQAKGAVHFTAPGGYAVTASDIRADVSSQHVSGGNRIEGRGPLGRFRAERFELALKSDRLILSGSAKLHIVQRQGQPRRKRRS